MSVSDFGAARKRLEAGGWFSADIRLLLDEVDRLKAEVERLMRAHAETEMDWSCEKSRAEKAEAELAAERERAERLEKALREIEDMQQLAHEALRSAAPDPTSSEDAECSGMTVEPHPGPHSAKLAAMLLHYCAGSERPCKRQAAYDSGRARLGTLALIDCDCPLCHPVGSEQPDLPHGCAVCGGSDHTEGTCPTEP